MRFAKRIFLFVAINFLVVLTISVILNVLNVRPFLYSHGLDYQSLMIFCLIWGMGGAFISLGLSRMMAKWMMGVKVIDPNTTDPQLRQFLHTVYDLCRAANIYVMPEVGIYESPEVNAFATGPTRNRSLVAVSSGLLRRMSPKEVEGVLAHEVTHIANGDMVTMTLIQGVVNAFVMFLARVLAFAFSGLGKERSRSSSYFTYTLLVIMFEVVFMLFGMMVIAGFSRIREYRADRGGAMLAGKDKMIAALEALRRVQEVHDERAEKPAFQALKISTKGGTGLRMLFATHPPLETRIEKLKELL